MLSEAIPRYVATRHFQGQLSDEDLNCANRVLDFILALIFVRDRHLDLNARDTQDINYLISFYLPTEVHLVSCCRVLVNFFYFCIANWLCSFMYAPLGHTIGILNK